MVTVSKLIESFPPNAVTAFDRAKHLTLFRFEEFVTVLTALKTWAASERNHSTLVEVVTTLKKITATFYR